MSKIKVSLFASAVRIPFFKTFLDSLIPTSIPYEVVFAGPCLKEDISEYSNNQNFRYITTGNIKPAQCYEVARRSCFGETVIWCADDCEFTPDLIGKAYNFWKQKNDDKAILSIQTVENGILLNMGIHRFFGGHAHTPLMAPLGMIGREYLDSFGGFDRRYICGQYENDAVMTAMTKGSKVYVFGDHENNIIIDHYRRHGITRPFGEGFNHDRAILESSWTNGAGKVLENRKDVFEPYLDDGTFMTKSQSFNKARWI